MDDYDYEDQPGPAKESPEPSGMGEDSILTHSVVYKTNHMGHMKHALDYLHKHHKEAEEMFKALKNGTEPGGNNYYKFEAKGYTYKLHKKSGGSYKLEWKQA